MLPKFKVVVREADGPKIWGVFELTWLDSGLRIAYNKRSDRWGIVLNTDPAFVALLAFTGFKDLEGTEIYEGDVVEVSITDYPTRETKRLVMTWTERYGHWAGQSFDGTWPCGYINGVCRIIGNVHLNPELMEEKK